MTTTLILNGSPRQAGNTAALIAELKTHLKGDVIELSAFYSAVSPCVDCCGCWTTAKCVVEDDMSIIYDDAFDNVVLASPIYFGTLPGSMLSLMSRLQPWHAAMYFLQKPLDLRPKKAAAIITAGGRGNHESVLRHLYPLFKQMNAAGFEEHIVYSPNTDTVPAWEDKAALEGVARLAEWLNE